MGSRSTGCRQKIRGAMESLKTAGESAVNSATGTLLFIWSKVSKVLPKRTDFTFKLDAGKSKATSLSVTLRGSPGKRVRVF